MCITSQCILHSITPYYTVVHFHLSLHHQHDMHSHVSVHCVQVLYTLYDITCIQCGALCASIPSSASRQHDVASNGVKAQLPHSVDRTVLMNQARQTNIFIFMHAHFNRWLGYTVFEEVFNLGHKTNKMHTESSLVLVTNYTFEMATNT